MSSSWEVTVTLCAVAVSGLADGDGAGVDVDVFAEAVGVETASCAIAMLVIMNSAPAKVGNFFIKYFCFQSLLIGCGLRVRRSRVTADASAQMRAAIRANCLTSYSAPKRGQTCARRTRAGRARRLLREETETGPTANLASEL